MQQNIQKGLYCRSLLNLTSTQNTKNLISSQEEKREHSPRNKLLIDCLYLSLLSFSTIGYGVLQPKQWLEFFRLEPATLEAKRWARIFVGIESLLGIYLLALLAIV